MNDGGRLLVLGGYGAFGGRLVRLLADVPDLTIHVAGRSRERAQRFCAGVESRASLFPLAFDRDGDVKGQLAEARPDVVVDASGPFQAYGDAPYRVVEACIALGMHYADLADGTEFVLGIDRFDAEAKARGVFVLSGARTFPTLSGAVVRRLADGLASVESVSAGIAPSPHAGLGLSVIRGIATYAGKPVRLQRDGRLATATGLVDAMRYTVAPPGGLPMDSRRFSLVDVPDLQLLPLRWPGLRDVWAGAGPMPGILHRGLNLMGWLVRLRLIPTLAPLGGLFHRTINVLRWGEHRGGMFLELGGRLSDGTRLVRSWHVTAERDDGPMIPSMAAAALVHRVLVGTPPAPGARPADRDLELEDYETQFARFRIVSGIRDDGAIAPEMPLYACALGAAWPAPALPDAIRHLYETGGVMVAECTATVERGRNLVARLVGALFRFPRAGSGVPVRVEISERDGGEVWRRAFAGRPMTSIQHLGSGRWARLVVERFGPFRFGLALVVDEGRLRLVPRRWSAFGLPMPRALLPRGDSYEAVENGRFAFHVEIRVPLLGLLVSYRGTLERRR